MPQTSYSPLERRQVEVAGSVVLKVLRMLPDSASAEMLRELIGMVLVDPDYRALFDFLVGGAKPDEEAAPVASPRFPVLSGGAAVGHAATATPTPTPCSDSGAPLEIRMQATRHGMQQWMSAIRS